MLSETDVEKSPLGKKSAYINEYDRGLLFPIPRKIKRDEISVSEPPPFLGFDVWNAYEISWLNKKGKPQVAIGTIIISCLSENIIESKSFKLYLNSFNNTKITCIKELEEIIQNDIEYAAKGKVKVSIKTLDEFTHEKIGNLLGENIDNQDISFDKYEVNSNYLECVNMTPITEIFNSNLLKSNCLVTGQPDWGSIEITYTGPQINKEGLLRYLVSFRDHNEFHEQCVERIFMDIKKKCSPETLTVKAYYTRRGGLDINPIRSSSAIDYSRIRTARQ